MNMKTATRIITLYICLIITTSCTSGNNSHKSNTEITSSHEINLENIYLGTDDISMYAINEDRLYITPSGKIVKTNKNNGVRWISIQSVFEHESTQINDASEYVRSETDPFYFSVRDIHNQKYEINLDVSSDYLTNIGFIPEIDIRGVYEENQDIYLIFSGYAKAQVEDDGLQSTGSRVDLSMNLSTSEVKFMVPNILENSMLTCVKVSDKLPDNNAKLYALFPNLQSQKDTFDVSKEITLYFDTSFSNEDIQAMLIEEDFSLSANYSKDDYRHSVPNSETGGY